MSPAKSWSIQREVANPGPQVPNPDEDQIEATHACVAKCDQGNGTQEQTDKYAECINACIKENYYDATQGTPKPTGAAGSDDDDEDTTKPDATTDSNAKPTDDSDSPSSSGTGVAPNKSDSEEKPSGTESADGKATESGDGDGAATGLVASSAALFGVVAAILAL